MFIRKNIKNKEAASLARDPPRKKKTTSICKKEHVHSKRLAVKEKYYFDLQERAVS